MNLSSGRYVTQCLSLCQIERQPCCFPPPFLKLEIIPSPLLTRLGCSIAAVILFFRDSPFLRRRAFFTLFLRNDRCIILQAAPLSSVWCSLRRQPSPSDFPRPPCEFLDSPAVQSFLPDFLLISMLSFPPPFSDALARVLTS